jgi:CheY-like chemotaxis protein
MPARTAGSILILIDPPLHRAMKKILIIEDDKIVASIYGNKFRAEGFQVETAADGLLGLEMVSNVEPDVVMLDLMLPKLSGVEVIKGIRAQDKFKDLPIVVFSNSYLSNLVQDAWSAGANRCLSKADSTPKHLIEIIKSFVSGSPPPPVKRPGAPATAPTPGTAPSGASHRSPMMPAAFSAAKPAPVVSADEAFQNELRKNFLENAMFSFGEIKTLLHAFTKSEDEITRLSRLFELYRRVNSMSSNAGVVGLQKIAALTSSLDQLLKELHDKSQYVNASTLRTVSHAINMLGILLERGREPDASTPVSGNVLVVDDDVISRRAIIYALEKAGLKNTSVEEPNLALKLLSVNSFDLVFLDIHMPGMNGFELCSKLRTIPMHERTSVIFVTSLADFATQARTTMSGGNDYIAKPFLFVEMSVKSITYVLKSRLRIEDLPA